MGFTLLVGVARVSAGVHYPSDILAGILVGWGSFVTVKALLKSAKPAESDSLS
jgi:membrane-associated phospholipid phosphatase